MSKRSNNSGTTPARIALGTIVTITMLVIVLIAQYVFGIDLTKDDPQPTLVATFAPATPIPANTPGMTQVAEVPGGALRPIDGGYDGGWIQIYFTTPLNTADESRFVGAPIENALVTALNNATTSIDAALFELNAQPVTDALIAAHERGVRVRFVTDGEHGLERPDTTVDQLEVAGIPVVSDENRGGLMHNKFFVIDGLWVWTGSTNITHNGFYNNNNNAVLIRSSQLAENYTDEFEELFRGEFGSTSNDNVIHQRITVNDTPIETIFESEGDAPTRLIELLEQASVVRFMTFSFTRGDMIEPILRRAKAGELDVMGIVESSQRRWLEDLFCAGLMVRQDGNPDILHHKVFIIDNDAVVMGSFNFSGNAADSNDENMLIIESQSIAQAYLNEFNLRWAEAQPVPAGTFQCS